jgi:hypothetical protein
MKWERQSKPLAERHGTCKLAFRVQLVGIICLGNTSDWTLAFVCCLKFELVWQWLTREMADLVIRSTEFYSILACELKSSVVVIIPPTFTFQFSLPSHNWNPLNKNHRPPLPHKNLSVGCLFCKSEMLFRWNNGSFWSFLYNISHLLWVMQTRLVTCGT